MWWPSYYVQRSVWHSMQSYSKAIVWIYLCLQRANPITFYEKWISFHISFYMYWYSFWCESMWPSWTQRSKGLGFDSHCWSCVEVSGKLLIPYFCCCRWVPGGQELWLSGSNCLHTCVLCALYSPRGDEIAQVVLYVSCTREGNWSVEYGIDVKA